MSLPTTRGGITRARKATDIKAEEHPERNKASGATCDADLSDSGRHRVILDRDNPVVRISPPAQPCTGMQIKLVQSGGPLKRARFQTIGNVPLRWEDGGPPALVEGRIALIEIDWDGTELVARTLASNLLIA